MSPSQDVLKKRAAQCGVTLYLEAHRIAYAVRFDKTIFVNLCTFALRDEQTRRRVGAIHGITERRVTGRS